MKESRRNQNKGVKSVLKESRERNEDKADTQTRKN
jgi:hypothetical protein